MGCVLYLVICLVGWDTLYPIVTSICEGPLRITGCLVVYTDKSREARFVFALTWHVIIPSRGECSSTPVRERRSLNVAELCQNVGAPSEAGNGTAKSPCCRVLSGLPSTVLASHACDFMEMSRDCKNRHDVLSFFLFFFCFRHGSNSFLLPNSKNISNRRPTNTT